MGGPQRALLEPHLRGYALTAICVPALAFTPFLAGAGLAVACVLILGSALARQFVAQPRPHCWHMPPLQSGWDAASAYTRHLIR